MSENFKGMLGVWRGMRAVPGMELGIWTMLILQLENLVPSTQQIAVVVVWLRHV